ncbi:MAG: SDR family oxidoreductase [Clostridiales bacterium]|nr:SDR family oxidoreductase [Clostridiales bacterium]
MQVKRAVVTGGTRGIGFATVKLLSECGYAVTALYSRNEEDAKKAQKALPNVSFVRADVSNEQDVERVFSGLERIDLLVNNAGISRFSQVQDTPWETWQEVMNVNAGGTFLCVKHALKKMLDFGGAIVNIASIWGQTGGSCESAYSASKGAVIAFTKAIAKELAPANIRVNCVSPGMINTEMNAELSKEAKSAFCEEVPLGREGSAEEIARAVIFLAESEYITGEVLSVNGGYYI